MGNFDRLSRRHAFAFSLVLLLALSGCQSGNTDPLAAKVPTASRSARSACSTTTVIGLRGSGERFDNATTYTGSPVLTAAAKGITAAKSAAAARMTAGANGTDSANSFEGSKMQLVNIKYEAAHMPTTLSQTALANYAKSVNSGAEAFVKQALKAAKACNQGTLLVIGYSQGAWAARVGINRLKALSNAGNSLARRAVSQIRGVGLIGDPLRSATDTYTQLGDAYGQGEGLARTAEVAFTLALNATKAKASDDLFPKAIPLNSRTVKTLCVSGDIVCDTSSVSRADFKRGIQRHLKAYTSTASGDGHSLAYELGRSLEK